MVEQLFAEYQGLGGSLDEKTYGGLRGLVGEMETNPIPDKAFIDHSTGVRITNEEEWVYSQLNKGVLGRFFGDQALIAEAMLVVMGNSEEREGYMRRNTHVDFRTDRIRRPAPKPAEGVRQITFYPTETVIFARGW
jgi:hypothetical protein